MLATLVWLDATSGYNSIAGEEQTLAFVAIQLKKLDYISNPRLFEAGREIDIRSGTPKDSPDYIAWAAIYGEGA